MTGWSEDRRSAMGVSTRGIASAKVVTEFILQRPELLAEARANASDLDSFRRIVKRAANKDWCGECEDWEAVRRGVAS